MVRLLTSYDKDQFIPLSKKCYDEMGFDGLGYEYDKNHISKIYDIMIKKHLMCGFFDNGIKGILSASITDTTAFFKGKLIAQEIVWHADPQLGRVQRIKIMKKLIEYAADWMKERGVKSFYVNTDARHDCMGQLLKNMGFTPVSTAFYKEV